MKEKIKEFIKSKAFFKLIAFVLIGSAGGYAYYYFIGCRTGGCPITSNWINSTLYGALVGLIAGFPSGKKKNEQNEDRKEHNN